MKRLRLKEELKQLAGVHLGLEPISLVPCTLASSLTRETKCFSVSRILGLNGLYALGQESATLPGEKTVFLVHTLLKSTSLGLTREHIQSTESLLPHSSVSQNRIYPH